MKKLFYLLLLVYSGIFAQVSSGMEQEFDYGIKNNSSQQILTPDTLVTKGVDGTYGHTSAYRLPLSTATKDTINTKIASNAGLQNAYNFEPEIVTSAIKGAVTLKRGSASDTDNILVGQNGAGVTTSSVKGNGEIYTATTPTATAFTHYFGQTASDGIIRPKTLADTRSEIVTTAAVNAAKPNIVTGTGTTNTIMKWGSSSAGTTSNLSDNGTLVTSTTDMSINGILVGRSSGTTTNNVRLSSNGLSFNTTGIRNSSFGDGALQNNTTGSDNVGFASNALRRNTDGSNNVAIGSGAGDLTSAFQNVTNISNSILIGKDVKVLNASGDTNCIAIGGNSLGSNTSVIGNSSTTFGRWWGNFLVGTSINNGNAGRFAGTVDVNSLQINTTPTTSAGGYDILTRNTSNGNVEKIPSTVLTGTLEFNVSGATVWNNGRNNVANNLSYGENALTAGSLSGDNNTGLGTNALRYLTTGTGNLALGQAGLHSSAGLAALTSATNSIFIGNGARALGDGNTNEIVVGNGVEGNGSNSVTLGGTAVTKTVLRGVIVYTTNYTVATLPTPTRTAFAVVTDATAPTYLGTLTGGGSVVCPVFFNGTAWVSH